MLRPYPSVHSRQHPRWTAVLENGDGMLEVRGERPILGHDGPFVVQGTDVRTADVHHGLDGERHAGHEPGTTLRLAVIRHLRVLVERRADPVSHQLPHHRVTRAFRHLLHRMADVAHVVAGPRRATPAASASWVTASSRSACAVTFPTGNVAAESACRPSSHTPTSTLKRSPSLSTRRADGMPWTTSWLIEVHSVAGKSYSPLKDGRAPGCERMNSSAARSSCSVDTPGRTWRATRASVSATMPRCAK